MGQLYCGVDIHKEAYAGCILDAQGNVVREQEFPARQEAVERFVTGIPNSHLTVAIEPEFPLI